MGVPHPSGLQVESGTANCKHDGKMVVTWPPQVRRLRKRGTKASINIHQELQAPHVYWNVNARQRTTRLLAYTFALLGGRGRGVSGNFCQFMRKLRKLSRLVVQIIVNRQNLRPNLIYLWRLPRERLVFLSQSTSVQTYIPQPTHWSARSSSVTGNLNNKGSGRRCVSSFDLGHASRAASMLIFTSFEARARLQKAAFKFQIDILAQVVTATILLMKGQCPKRMEI